MLCLTGGDFLGWFKFDDIFKISNTLKSVVYAFAIVDRVPDRCILPFNVKSTFYVGESGVKDLCWDQKNKINKKGRFETSVHKRMKDHSYNLIKTVKEHVENDEFVCVALFVPKENVSDDYSKHWQKNAESELIYYYGLMFNQTPEYNKAHKNSNFQKNNSISRMKVEQLKNSNLDKFLK
jgi:hypothetical protein